MSADAALLARVRERLIAEGGAPTAARVAEALREVSGGLHGATEAHAVLRGLQDEIVGAGPLQALLSDPQTSGGLLVSCDPGTIDEVLAVFRRHGFGEAAVIGEVGAAGTAATLVVN